MKKISIFLVSFAIFLFLASFINQNKVFAVCNPTNQCYQGGLPCPAEYPKKAGSCGSLTYPGQYCCTEDTEDTCTILNYTGNPTSYACKNSCGGEGESESSLGNCTGTQKCCAFLTPASSGSCDDNSDCYSGKCDLNKHVCQAGTTKIACIEDPADSGKFKCKTALGEINTDPEGFARSILRIFLGVAGGILLVLIILNGYKFMTSQGDPEKIKDAREGIIAAIAGILLIIFSIAILRLIAVDIIGIPGFS